jgi:hypothetical protein
MHWDNLEGADIIEAWVKDTENKKKSKAGDDRTPAWGWKHRTYNDGEHIAIPSDVLRACLTKAGAKITLSGKTTYKTVIPCGLAFPDPYMTFFCDGKQIPWAKVMAVGGDGSTNYTEHCNGARELGFSLFAKRAAVGASKHIRVRTRFDIWSVAGRCTVIDDTLLEKLDEVFNVGGHNIGMCDWRPGAPKSPGPFGMFTAELKKV